MSELNYSKSGVNIDEGNRFVSIIKKMVESTHNKSVIGGLGGFAGFYDITNFKDMKQPVLVSSTDGVGTKLKLAIESQKYDTVGVDLVAMSVNDLIVTGARPLFFLDYIATGHLAPEAMADVVKGIVDGCKDSGCALLGGETAEMPGMYAAGDFDLAGFAVGIVDKEKAIDGSRIKPGDLIIGIESSGFHSNGFSLLRKIFEGNFHTPVNELIPGFDSADEKLTVAELLLTPTRIYVKNIMAALDAGCDIKGMVHITGGGFYDNIPRVLPEGLGADIEPLIFPQNKAVLALEKYIQAAKLGIDRKELYRVFNMGIGFIMIVAQNELQKLVNEIGCPVHIIGRATDSGTIKIKGID